MKIMETIADLRSIDVELEGGKIICTLDLACHGKQHSRHSRSIELDDIDTLKQILGCFEWLWLVGTGTRYTVALFEDAKLQGIRRPDGSGEAYLFRDGL